MKKMDFVFTIGYSGPSALIDKRSAQKYGHFSLEQLLEAGLFKAAFSSALFDNDETGMDKVLSNFNHKTKRAYESVEQLKRAFGVYSVPEKIHKTIFV